jgi:glutamate--cysteine ligase
MEQRETLRDAVPRMGLDASLPGTGSGTGGTLRDLAREVLTIARGGLVARDRRSKAGDSEAGFLEPLDEIVASGKVPAQRLLDKYHGPWGGDISRIYEESF